MKSRKFMAVAMAAISIGTMAAFASCGGNDNSGSSEKKSLNITGSSSVSPLMGKLADAYKKEHGDVKITVTTSDSGTGVKDAQSGLNDFGMASRQLEDFRNGRRQQADRHGRHRAHRKQRIRRNERDVRRSLRTLCERDRCSVRHHRGHHPRIGLGHERCFRGTH